MEPNEIYKLGTNIKIIKNYVAGGKVPTGNKSPEKLLRWLIRTTGNLKDFVIFKTAGAYQPQAEERYKECLKLIPALKGTIQWYKDLPKNPKQREWQMEFHRIGTGKSLDRKETDRMKIKRRKDADEQMTIPQLLRKIACDEIISYYAYMAGAENVHGENWMDAKQQFEEHAKDELEHFESIQARLYQLGEPVHAVFKTIAESCNYYWDLDMEDVKTACEVAKKAEEEAIEGYRNLLVAIAETEITVRDFATQRLAKKNLEAEQDHLQDMIHLEQEF